MMYADFKLVPLKSFNLLLLVKSVTPSLKITSISGITVSSVISSSNSTAKVSSESVLYTLTTSPSLNSISAPPKLLYVLLLILLSQAHSINCGKFISTFLFIVGILIPPIYQIYLTDHSVLVLTSNYVLL